MIEEILEELAAEDLDAMIVPAASSSDLIRCQKSMKELSLPALPKEYVDFLKQANGVSWNGCEFFGTDQVTDPQSGYKLRDVVSENEAGREKKPDIFASRLLLGRMDDDIFTYSADLDAYEVLDGMTGILIEEFDTFDELFSVVLDPLLFSDEDEEDELSFEDDDYLEEDADDDEDDDSER